MNLRILIIAPRVAIDHAQNTGWTGLDLLLKDLIEGYLEAGNQVCVVSPHLYRFEKGYNRPEWCFQTKACIPYIPLTEFKGLSKKRKQFGVKAFFRQLRSDLFYSWIIKAIKKFEPDVVHIHSAIHWAGLGVQACRKYNLPFLVTLHGINASNPMCASDVVADEEYFLMKMAPQAQLITAVSRGTKEAMEAINPELIGKIKVLLNGTNMMPVRSKSKKILKKYNIPLDAKVIVCVGTVGKRKNQELLIKAFNEIDSVSEEETWLMIVGKDTSKGKIEQETRLLECAKHVVFTGFIDKSNIPQIFSIAALNVVVSKSEGFGLSIIEAMRCGVPSLVFEGIDVFRDLQDMYSVESVSSLNMYDLSLAIQNSLNSSYDHDRIMKEGELFEFSKIASKYIELLKHTLGFSRNE